MRKVVIAVCVVGAIGSCSRDRAPAAAVDMRNADVGTSDAAFGLDPDTSSDSPSDSPPDAGATCGSWREGPTLLHQRFSSPTFLLPSGQVIVVSGHFRTLTREPILVSELLDLTAGTSTETGSFNVSRSDPGPTTMLADGRVLSGSHWPPEVVPAEVWDPATGEWPLTREV